MDLKDTQLETTDAIQACADQATAGAAVEAPAVADPGGEPSPFTHFEGDVVTQLAVERKKLARWRKTNVLAKGADWEFVTGRVHYSAAGVERAGGLVTGRIAEPVVPVLEKKRAALEDVRVTGHLINPTLVTAETAGGEKVRVRVRRSRAFVTGMVLLARRQDAGLYVYEGNEPRWVKDPHFYRPFPAA